MKTVMKIMILSTTFFLALSKAGSADYVPVPIFYPYGKIENSRPYFIWQDKYIMQKDKSNTKYRITLKGDKKELNSIIFQPERYYKFFFVYRFPTYLSGNKYIYEIERLVDNKSVNESIKSVRTF